VAVLRVTGSVAAVLRPELRQNDSKRGVKFTIFVACGELLRPLGHKRARTGQIQFIHATQKMFVASGPGGVPADAILFAGPLALGLRRGGEHV